MRFLACLLLLLTLPVLAVPPEGDFMAKRGIYDLADGVYQEALAKTKDPHEIQLLELRRMAVAQLRNDLGTVFEMSRELRAMKLEPEVAMRVNLIEGIACYRVGSVGRAQKCYQEARAIASKLKTAGAALGLSECESFDYLIRLDREGVPATQDYARECERILGIGNRLRPTAADPYWPLDVMRATTWSWYWAYRAWEYSFYFYMEHNEAAAGEWGGMSGQIYTAALVLMDRSLADSGNDYEWFWACMRMRTQMASAFSLFPQIENLIRETGNYLDIAAKDLAPVSSRGFKLTQLDMFWGEHHRSLGRFHVFQKKVDQGIQELQQAAEDFARAGDQIDQIDCLNEIGYHAALNDLQVDPAAVDRALQSADAVSVKAQYPFGRFYATGLRGCRMARTGDLPGAEKLLTEAVALLDEWLVESGASYRGKERMLRKPETQLFMNTLTDVLIKQGKTAEAAEMSARKDARRQMSGIDLSRVKSSDPQVTRTLRSIEQNRTEGDEIKAELRAAEARGDESAASQLRTRAANNKADFYKQINELRKREPEFERLLTVKPASLATLQKRLPPNALLVEYSLSPKNLRIFVVSSTELKLYESNLGEADLEAKVRQLRRLITSGQAEIGLLGELYDALIGPLQADLADKEMLVVVPNGPLYYLPFAALKGPQGYLVQSKSLVVATSGDVFNMALDQNQGSKQSLLALANPDSSLPGARAEVEQLAPLFAQRETYYESQATKARLTPVKASVIHFATHGFLNSFDVNESYLLMAGSDDKLTSGDIYALELKNVSLVTLSACQTSLGEKDPLSGSDIATLATAFSIAGSRSILASLWKVDDRATTELMVEFYTQLLAGKNKAEALRGAQTKLAGKGLSPDKWAAFELIGDWQ